MSLAAQICTEKFKLSILLYFMKKIPLFLTLWFTPLTDDHFLFSIKTKNSGHFCSHSNLVVSFVSASPMFNTFLQIGSPIVLQNITCNTILETDSILNAMSLKTSLTTVPSSTYICHGLILSMF